jgi:hypothetical protein
LRYAPRAPSRPVPIPIDQHARPVSISAQPPSSSWAC